VEVEHEVLCIFRLQIQHLLASDDGSTDAFGLIGIAIRAPLNVDDVALANEGFVERVTLVVRDREQFVVR
jgi:hypothetical protein